MKNKETLKDWLTEFQSFKATEWGLLPDIDLYMDQVTNYLRRQLALQEKDEENPIITSNMINNYIKGGHIDRATQKKYNKEQLASLYMLCSIKQSLSINDASLLLSSLKEGSSTEALYTEFIQLQKSISTRFADFMADCESKTKNELLSTALSLALSSVAEQLLAEKILSLFYIEEDEQEKKKKKEKKKKSEENEIEKEKKTEKKDEAKSEKNKTKTKKNSKSENDKEGE